MWRGDRWVTDRTASKDPVFKKSTPDGDVDRLIRNTYKVLLTRGMVGTVMYSSDAETRDKLRQLVTGVHPAVSAVRRGEGPATAVVSAEPRRAGPGRAE